jgi:predicted nucleic acid-binding protein
VTETWYDSYIRQKVKDPLIITARALEGEIYELAKSFQKKGGLSAKDAVHLACASFVGADVFLTCDDRLIRQAKRLFKLRA